MHKIVISGYYGFNNIGDESILQSVIENLRKKVSDIEITVLSKTPETTRKKYDVNSIDRMNIKEIYTVVKKSDLLISGGGSLLQDVTSWRNILYYLLIMLMGIINRKKVLIYSQGIGPINSKINRKLVKWVLNRVNYIAVRDNKSKELLDSIGVRKTPIYVTADPVIRLKKADINIGEKILKKEGFNKDIDKLTIGFAIRGLNCNSTFIKKICDTSQLLIEEYNAQIVFIPFHFKEDMNIINEINSILGDKASYVTNKYLTNEMLSIIGNLDILIGVRLHSLIHAAIMDVPMIAISYDPKIEAFMKSLELDTLCKVDEFNSDKLLDKIKEIVANKEEYINVIKSNIKKLIKKLDKTEELINELLE